MTEWVTGLDLIKEQIRIASGEALSVSQKDIRISGHAIECQDQRGEPGQKLPALPGDGSKVCICREAAGCGWTPPCTAATPFPPYYDSMIAKLIVHGKDRREAIAKMISALGEVIVEGIDTNVDYLYRILNEPDYQAGRTDIEYLKHPPYLKAGITGYGMERIV